MRPEVRAVLVCDGGEFVGVITRKTLVREVVARGLDPRTTTLREIAEVPNATIDSDDAALARRSPSSRSATTSGCRSSTAAGSSACCRARRSSADWRRTTPAGGAETEAELGREQSRLGDRGERVQRVAELLADLVVNEAAVLVELLGGAADRELDLATRAPMAPSTLRSSACAHTAPNRPALEPITATGFPTEHVGASGRDAQSSAFFSAPGIEELYSGVAIRTASADATAARSVGNRREAPARRRAS